MKYLSLNTHSWMEKEPLEKLEQTAVFIAENGVDIIALQEVNQLIESVVVDVDEYFCPLVTDSYAIRIDNYAKCLVELLREKGLNYYWSWTCSHIGYDIYEEGSAILSKYPFEAESIQVSPTSDIQDYHTRQILLANIKEESEMIIASCHFSWWSENKVEGFYYEWQSLLERLQKQSNQVLLLGDFNTPAHIKNEGYQLVTNTFSDVYSLAQERIGSHTVPSEIDGWEGNTEKLRIDFGFILKPIPVQLYQVIFDGENGPQVSDHFGIMIEI